MLEPTRWASLSRKASQGAGEYTWAAYLDKLETVLYDHCDRSIEVAIPEAGDMPVFPPAHETDPREWNRL
jgi:hypothetical protein